MIKKARKQRTLSQFKPSSRVMSKTRVWIWIWTDAPGIRHLRHQSRGQGRPFIWSIGPFIGPFIWSIGPFIGPFIWSIGPFIGPFVHWLVHWTSARTKLKTRHNSTLFVFERLSLTAQCQTVLHCIHHTATCVPVLRYGRLSSRTEADERVYRVLYE